MTRWISISRGLSSRRALLTGGRDSMLDSATSATQVPRANRNSPHTRAVVRRLRADGALATAGAAAGAVTGAVRSAEESGASSGPPAAGGTGIAVDDEGVSASTCGASSSPSSVHQITGTVSLYPRLGTVAMYSRLTSSPSLSDLRSSEILCVTTWLVTTFRVQTFSISSSRLSTSPGWRAKKTRRSIKRGSRVSWRPFLLIWFTEGVTSHSPTRTTGCSIQKSPRQKGKGAMITHLSYLFLPGVTPSGIRSELAFY